MSPKNYHRHRLLVDSKVQGALLVRLALYWLFCIVSAMLFLVVWRTLTGSDAEGESLSFWYSFAPALAALVFLYPIVAVDLIRQTNRFAGPMVRLRRAMRALASGEPVEPVQFRDDDYWHPLAAEFNQLVAKVQSLETSTSVQPSPRSGEPG